MNTKTQPIVWRRGKLTLLRSYEESDIEHFRRWINDPTTNKYLNVIWPQSKTAQQEWFARSVTADPDHIRVAILTHEGELIGNMSLDIDVRKQSATTGSLIGEPRHRGKGYSTDAKMLLLDYAFNWRGLRKVTSKIFAFNERSQNYAKRCGYRHMATIEQEHFRGGKWVDEEQYVVFREEWLPLWKEYTKDWTPDWE